MSDMSPEVARTLCDIFNFQWPVGTAVTLVDDLGEWHPTNVKWAASVSSAGDPVVGVEGKAGGWLLSRIIPVNRARVTSANPTSAPKVPAPKLKVVVDAVDKDVRTIYFCAAKDAAFDVERFGRVWVEFNSSRFILKVDTHYDLDEVVAYMESYG